MAGLREGRVKIYNVKQVKTEVTLGPPKLCRNQKSFWVLSNQPPGLCFFSEMFNQLDTGIQYSGRHDKKYGDFFKTALNRARPGLHEFT